MSDPAKVVRLVDLKAIEVEAAAWIARLDSASGTSTDQADFEAWKAQSVHHREAAEKLGGLWSDLGILGQLAAPSSAVAATAHRGRRGTWALGHISRRSTGIAAVAAGMAAAIGMGLFATQILTPRTEIYDTAVGAQRTVNLADGSSVQLNTNSRLEVRFTPESRDLKLVRGEAFFEVAPNRQRPFSVYVQDGVVRAVGTAFIVRLRSERVEVIVTKGSVELASFTQPPRGLRLDRAASLPRRPLEVVSVAPGVVETAIIAQDKVERSSVTGPEATRRMAWRQGMLAFDGQPLSEVVADVSRYTNMEIEIADPRLSSMKIGGYFKVGEVEPMLEALEAGFGVQVQRLDATHVRLTAAS